MNARDGRLAAAVLGAAAAATWVAPEACAATRSGLADGELWRLWSGHLVHASPNHFAFDVPLTAVLVARTRAWRYLFVAPPLLTLAVFAARADLASYVGLSGLLHGLTWIAAASIARDATGWRRVGAAVIAAGTLGKVLVEVLLRESLVAWGVPATGIVAFEAHALGCLLALPVVIGASGRLSVRFDAGPRTSGRHRMRTSRVDLPSRDARRSRRLARADRPPPELRPSPEEDSRWTALTSSRRSSPARL